MSLVVTDNADIQCGHSGTVTINSGSGKLSVDGNKVVTSDMLTGASIAGCTNTATPNIPCTVLSTVSSGLATKLNDNSKPVILETLTFITNGSVPTLGFVNDTGQTKLDSV